MPRKKKLATPARDPIIHPRHIKMVMDTIFLVCQEDDGPFDMNPDDDQTAVACMLTAYTLGTMIGAHFAYQPAGHPLLTKAIKGTMDMVQEGIKHGKENAIKNAASDVQSLIAKH